MAKEDFCFTYYDGDAARDKAHLDRLQRGAYDDIISAQRKFGHLSIEVIKRVLGGDFEYCWPPIEWILKKDKDGNFFIDWLENSIEKSRAHSKKQKEKIDQYWKKKKDHGNTTVIPQNNPGITPVIPLEDGNENGNEDKEERVGGVEEGELIYDAEHAILKKSVWLDQLLCSRSKSLKEGKEALRMYHLYLVENNRYPRSISQCQAGFEKWLLNEKNFNYAGKQSTNRGGSPGRPVVTEGATTAGKF